MNPAVKNENGPLAGDPLPTKRNFKTLTNTITFRRERSNSVYPFCNSDITSAIHAEEGNGVRSEGSNPTRNPAPATTTQIWRFYRELHRTDQQLLDTAQTVSFQ